MTAKTMPSSQCLKNVSAMFRTTCACISYGFGFVWAQKNQSGVDALVTLICHWGNGPVVVLINIKPEVTPWVGVVCWTQGLAKVDCVTDC